MKRALLLVIPDYSKPEEFDDKVYNMLQYYRLIPTPLEESEMMKFKIKMLCNEKNLEFHKIYQYSNWDLENEIMKKLEELFLVNDVVCLFYCGEGVVHINNTINGYDNNVTLVSPQNQVIHSSSFEDLLDRVESTLKERESSKTFIQIANVSKSSNLHLKKLERIYSKERITPWIKLYTEYDTPLDALDVCTKICETLDVSTTYSELNVNDTWYYSFNKSQSNWFDIAIPGEDSESDNDHYGMYD